MKFSVIDFKKLPVYGLGPEQLYHSSWRFLAVLPWPSGLGSGRDVTTRQRSYQEIGTNQESSSPPLKMSNEVLGETSGSQSARPRQHSPKPQTARTPPWKHQSLNQLYHIQCWIWFCKFQWKLPLKHWFCPISNCRLPVCLPKSSHRTLCYNKSCKPTAIFC